jgi:hypothetical protein
MADATPVPERAGPRRNRNPRRWAARIRAAHDGPCQSTVPRTRWPGRPHRRAQDPDALGAEDRIEAVGEPWGAGSIDGTVGAVLTGHRLGNRWAHSASLRSSWDAVSREPQVGTAVSPIRTHGDGQSTRFPILCSEFPVGRGRCAPEADTNTESGSRGRLVTAHTGRMQMTGPVRCTRLWATRCRSTTTPAVRWRATGLPQCNRDEGSSAWAGRDLAGREPPPVPAGHGRSHRHHGRPRAVAAAAPARRAGRADRQLWRLASLRSTRPARRPTRRATSQHRPPCPRRAGL